MRDDRLAGASGIRLFEVDQPGPQAWQRRRLFELGFGVPEWLRLVPVDFDARSSWLKRLRPVRVITAPVLPGSPVRPGR